MSAIHQVQQKSGLKNLLLEKRMELLSDQIEKKEAQLGEILTESNLDPNFLTSVTKKLNVSCIIYTKELLFYIKHLYLKFDQMYFANKTLLHVKTCYRLTIF